MRSVAHRALPLAALTVLLASASLPVAAAPSAPALLTALPEKSLAGAKAQAAVYDAGAVNSLDSQEIAHTFQIRNSGTSSVVIDDLTSSCGCTTGLLMDRGLPQSLPMRLAPGQKIGIQVQVSLAGDTMDSVDKYVWVHVRDQDEPALTLEIKATLPPLVVLLPNTLDFGHVPSGTEKDLVVIAEVSPLLPPTDTVVTLAERLPFLDIGPPIEDGFTPDPAGGKAEWRRLKFTIRLDKNSPIGSFAADLTVHITRIGILGQASGQDLPNTYAVMRGSVNGEIAAMPSSLVFGTVTTGQGATKTFTIKGLTPGVLADITAISASDWVAVSSDSPPQADASVYRVQISPSTPPGPLETRITFTTKSGQTLNVPVLAYIAN